MSNVGRILIILSQTVINLLSSKLFLPISKLKSRDWNSQKIPQNSPRFRRSKKLIHVPIKISRRPKPENYSQTSERILRKLRCFHHGRINPRNCPKIPSSSKPKTTRSERDHEWSSIRCISIKYVAASIKTVFPIILFHRWRVS